MFSSRIRCCLALFVSTLLPFGAVAEDGGNQANDDEFSYQDYQNQHLYDMQDVDDNIQYWTSFYIRARRCVVYKNVDVVVFEVFGEGDQCMDEASYLLGTYYTSVPNYMDGYLAEVAQKMEDRGVDDYVEPDVAQYQYCTPHELQSGEIVYLQLGCADDTTQSIAVNVYKDNTCEKRATNQYGIDDANMDISEIQLPFKKCLPCVNWVNPSDDQIDDQFYEKRQMMAPLCSAAWADKKECGMRCKNVGLKDEIDGWGKSGTTLLIILLAFGAIVGALIWRKRQKLPARTFAVENAAMNMAGLSTTHLAIMAGIFALIVLLCGFLGFKNITLALILMVDILLFGYLMKLTFDGSQEDVVVGPDGQILQKADSEDSEDASRESSVRPQNSSGNNGTYMLPTLT